VARAAASGVDTAPLICRAGLFPDDVADPKVRIETVKQVALLTLTAEALQDELLGLHLGAEFDLREVGLVYFVLASSGTLAEALARAERYTVIANDGILLHRLGEGEFGIRYSYVGVPRHADRHQIEFWAMALVRIAAQLTGTRIRPVRIAFAHPRCASPDQAEQAEAILGCRVAYGASQDEVAFTPAAAALPLTGADPYLNNLLVGYCEDALAHRARPTEALRTRAENAITPLLPHGKARVGDVARALGMSQRSLSRHLSSDGQTFAAILDELRLDLARHYLRDEPIGV
jgi:DNA-binding transcriptional ArsR family regulator